MQDHWKGLGRHGTIGLEFLLSIVVGFLAGQWLDKKLSTHGWLTLIGFGFGVAAGFRAIWDAAQRMRRETEQADEDERKRRADVINRIDRKHENGPDDHDDLGDSKR